MQSPGFKVWVAVKADTVDSLVCLQCSHSLALCSVWVFDVLEDQDGI